MKHADGTYDLTVDDIHEIRVNTSKMLEKMTNEEIIEFFNKAEEKFYKNNNLKDTLLA